MYNVVQFWHHNYQRHNKFETAYLIGTLIQSTDDASNEHKIFKPSEIGENQIRRGVELFELLKELYVKYVGKYLLKTSNLFNLYSTVRKVNNLAKSDLYMFLTISYVL